MARLRLRTVIVVLLSVLACLATLVAQPMVTHGDVMPAEGRHLPSPPSPEPIEVDTLPLPRTVTGMQSGRFLPDGHEVSASVQMEGGDASNSGSQLIIVKTDAKKFPNGDAWKCITCGMPSENAMGANADYGNPQPFRDGKRVLAGTNVIDCAPYMLIDRKCTPDAVHAYPIFWETAAAGATKAGNIRELRLHPDNVHLGFNHIIFDPILGQEAYIGRLTFNPSPTNGATPRPAV